MPKARRIILNINFKKTIADKIFSRKSIIIEFKSITEAEEKLGIDKSLLHKLLETNKELEGILAIVEGDMGFIDKTEKTETETAKMKQQRMQEHLQRVLEAKKHRTHEDDENAIGRQLRIQKELKLVKTINPCN